MISFLVFDKNTGKVAKKCTAPDDESAALQCGERETYIKTDLNDKDHYVNLTTGQVEEKIENPSVLSGLNLTSLLVPCTVSMRGPTKGEVYVEQGDLTLDADVPGSYRVTVVADDPRYYDAEFEVDL